MSDLKDEGVIQALMQRFESQRLPRALKIKESAAHRFERVARIQTAEYSVYGGANG